MTGEDRPCECPPGDGPVDCPRWGCRVFGRFRQACRGETGLPREQELALLARLRRPVPKAEALPPGERPAEEPPPPPGPGTELKKLLLEFGVEPGGCSCEEMARRMDAWGVEGCREHRAEIIRHLAREAKARGWLEKLKASGLAAKRGITGYGALVDEAIRRASTAGPAGIESFQHSDER